MQRFGIKSAVVALGLVGLVSSAASAATLYSTGFEDNASTPAPEYTVNTFLDQNPNWAKFSTPAGSNNPFVAVYGYSGTADPTNLNYVQLTASGASVANNVFYLPTDTVSYNAATGTDKTVAITFTMNLRTGTNNPVFGVTAFDIAGNPLGTIGVNGSTGELFGATTTVSPFTAAVNTIYNYQLRLDYTSQTVSLLTGVGSSPYTLRGTAPFQTSATTFGDADLAVFNASGTGNYSGVAELDNLAVNTVPEPAGLGLLAAAGLSIGRRRARNRA